MGVVAEASLRGAAVLGHIVRSQIRTAPRDRTPTTTREFVAFYIPLALTSLITFFVSPVGRYVWMPDPLSSLAVWPVVSGFIAVLRSQGSPIPR